MGSWIDELDQEILEYLDTLVKRGLFSNREEAVKGVLRSLAKVRKSRTRSKIRPTRPGKPSTPDIGGDVTIMLRKIL